MHRGVPKKAHPSRRRSGRGETVTIKDVAHQAGVSVATVSRVLNDKGPVAPATRNRIREVAERLRYVPHGAARSLITNKTNAIGVLLPDIYGEFFSEIIRGIDLAAGRRVRSRGARRQPISQRIERIERRKLKCNGRPANKVHSPGRRCCCSAC